MSLHRFYYWIVGAGAGAGVVGVGVLLQQQPQPQPPPPPQLLVAPNAVVLAAEFPPQWAVEVLRLCMALRPCHFDQF